MARGSAVALALAALGAGCHSEREAASPPVLATGPAGVIRVGLAKLPWPLDPPLLEGRDELTVGRALLATPLRASSDGSQLRPGLCGSWRSDASGREWRFSCRHARAIARSLRGLRQQTGSPWRFLVADAERIVAPAPRTLVVRLRYPWRRFPWALTSPATAPRGVPGPFRLVSGSRTRIVARRGETRLIFRRLEAHRAAAAFRRGALDEAPVPSGDLRAVFADPGLQGAVRTRPILAVDLVELGEGVAESVRRTLWRTAPRSEYRALVPENGAPLAYGLLAGRTPPGVVGSASSVRRARAGIPSLPKTPVTIAVPAEPELRYAASTVWAHWRDLGLPVRLRRQPGEPAEARFRRLLAAYPHEEAFFLALRFAAGRREPTLLAALAAADPTPALRRLDRRLRDEALLVPLARAQDARLVSSRLRGWAHDTLGSVDYAAVALARPVRNASRAATLRAGP